MMGRSTALFPEAGRPVMRKRRLFAIFCIFMMIFLKRCFIIDIDSAEIWFR